MTQALKRGLFGYRSKSVMAVLAGREAMFELAVDDARHAQERGDKLAIELETALSDMAQAKADLEAAEAALSSTKKELGSTQAERDIATADRDRARTELKDAERRLSEATTNALKLQVELDDARSGAIEVAERTRVAAAELVAARRQIAEKDAKIVALESAASQIPEAPAVPEVPEVPAAPEALPAAAAPAVTGGAGDLDAVLRHTETAIHDLLEQARRTAEAEVAEVERRRDALKAEVDVLMARRDRLAPLAKNVRELLGEAKARAGEADLRLRTALEPLTRTVGVLQDRLVELIDEAEEAEDDDTVEVSEDSSAGTSGSSTVIHLAEGHHRAGAW